MASPRSRPREVASNEAFNDFEGMAEGEAENQVYSLFDAGAVAGQAFSEFGEGDRPDFDMGYGVVSGWVHNLSGTAASDDLESYAEGDETVLAGGDANHIESRFYDLTTEEGD